MKIVKVGMNSLDMSEMGDGIRISSPIYVNPDNVIWIEIDPDTLGSRVYFNTDRGTAGVAYITIHDVIVSDMKNILSGRRTYEDVCIPEKECRFQLLSSLK